MTRAAPSWHLRAATDIDAPELAGLHTAVAGDLTARFGKGHWSSPATEKGVLRDIRTSSVWIARSRGRLIATLRLATKKPWAIDTSYFTPCVRPLYLTSMAVALDRQGTGVGTHCLELVRNIAREWPADMLRLDAYDTPAGAGTFYAKCGFRVVGRAVYRGTPLVYFEMPV
jgi:GNAT superfamily N-acetyltransferase